MGSASSSLVARGQGREAKAGRRKQPCPAAPSAAVDPKAKEDPPRGAADAAPAVVAAAQSTAAAVAAAPAAVESPGAAAQSTADAVAAALAAVGFPGGAAADAPLGTSAEPGAPFQPWRSGPPLPPCEGERLACVEAMHVLDSLPEPALKNILELLCGMFDTRSGMIALFGDRRIYVKEATGFGCGDFPWRQSFCGWSLSTPLAQPLVVPDARADARFARNPLVAGGQVGFYVGCPLLASSGHRIGTISCADPRPRPFDDRHCFLLANFAELVSRQLERDVFLAAQRGLEARAAAAAATQQQQQRQRQQEPTAAAAAAAAGTAVDELQPLAGAGGVLCVDAAGGAWRVVNTTPGAEALLGCTAGALAGRPLWDFFEAPGGSATLSAVSEAAAAGGAFKLLGAALAGGGRGRLYELMFTPASAPGPVQPGAPPILLPTFIPEAPVGAGRPCPTLFFVAARPLAPPPSSEATASTATTGGAAAGAAAAAGGLSSVGDSSSTAQQSASDTTWGPSGGIAALRRGVAREAIEGLRLGPAIAAGSYGRVYKGRYNGTQVAVKVLEDDAITKRDPETGASLEAVLSHSLTHPNIVSTLAWSTVYGRACVEKASPLKGETLGTPERPALAALRRRTQQAAAAAAAAAAPAPLDALMVLDGGDWEGQRGSMGGGSGERDEEGEEDGPGQTWIVLEYCDKGCLQDAIDRGWLLESPASAAPDLMAVLVTAREIAAALAYLHSRGVVHGDLSAFNVMLSSGGAAARQAGRGWTAKVADFGLSRLLDVGAQVQTKTYGTITHAAPEVLSGGIVSSKSDVYSWGVLLWQMSCGLRPWAGMSHAAVVKAVVADRRTLRFPPGCAVPEALQLLAAAAMDRDPDARPTCEDLLEVLAPIETQLITAAPPGL